MPSNPGERAIRIAEEKRRVQELEKIKAMQDGVMARVPRKGKGVIIVPDTNPLPTYPYPQHLPRAAVQRIVPPAGVVAPASCPPDAAAPTSSDDVMFIACGIAIAIVALFAWVFWAEVLRYGGTIGVMFLVWKLYEWDGQRKLQNRENEMIQRGRLTPEQRELYIVHPVPQAGFVGALPGGW